MKRLHVHVAVDDLETSIRFYAALFAAQPSVRKPDYAKWMIEVPRVNFAISKRSGMTGVDHLGIQVEDAHELDEVYGRLRTAERPVLEQGATTCCYAKSEKSWIADPQGIAWETFLTRGESTLYGNSADVTGLADGAACCAPSAAEITSAPVAAATAGCCSPVA